MRTDITKPGLHLVTIFFESSLLFPQLMFKSLSVTCWSVVLHQDLLTVISRPITKHLHHSKVPVFLESSDTKTGTKKVLRNFYSLQLLTCGSRLFRELEDKPEEAPLILAPVSLRRRVRMGNTSCTSPSVTQSPISDGLQWDDLFFPKLCSCVSH